jgi:hypothetical protein
MKNALYSLAFLGWMLACQGGGTGEPPTMAYTDKMAEVPGSPDAGAPADEGMSPKVIRQGQISFVSRDAMAARRALDRVRERFGAEVQQEYLSNTDYEIRYTLQLRVPATRLDSLVAALENGLGEVEQKSIQAQDVTAEYIDLETRMANKRAYLDQYRALLKETRTIDDALRVREQIRQLEEELESVTARRNYLAGQVAMSTLEVTIVQRKPYVYRPDTSISFLERMKESLSGGWAVFVQFCLGLLRLWPFLILITLLAMLYRRRRRKRAMPPPPQ